MQITEAELEVMKALWRKPGLGAAEVHETLSATTGWSIRTVKTLLARLVEKGALETHEDGRRYLYQPLIAQEDYQSEATTRFVDRLFAGRAAPLVAHLADSRGLSKDDIKELEQLLGELKAGEQENE